MPQYDWRCHSCKALNERGTDICNACDFVAIASGAEIEEAITGIKSVPRQSRKEWQAERRAEIAVLPLLKKLLAHMLQGIRVIGAVIAFIGIFNLSFQGIALGLAVVAVAELLYHLLKGKSYVRDAT